ncbi:MAG: gliding motility-associated C-terminal domain-containing protein [Bacteroidia bacterium]
MPLWLLSDFASTNLGGNRIICSNDSVELDAGPNKDSYLWSTGATTQTITVTEPGIYYVNTIKDGCEASDTATVIDDLSVIDLGPDVSVCGGTPVTLNAGSSFINYSWNGGSTDSTLTVTQAGTYIVEAESLSGCIFKDTIVVGEFPIPEIPQLEIPDPICEFDDILLSPTRVTGDIFWSGPQGFNSEEPEINLESISTSNSGSYQLYQVENNCPSDTLNFTLTVQELPQPEIIGDTIICEGETSALVVLNGPYDSVTWNTGSTETFLEDIPSGTYSVEVVSGGCSAVDTLVVIADEPVAQFVVTPDTLVFLGTEFQFADSSDTIATGLVNYYWDFDNGDFAEGSFVSYTYPDTGEYAVVYTVVNENGCVDTVISNVYVIRDIIVPNAFSPNGDGINDFFVVKYLEIYPNSYLVIYNRWGNRIYENSNYQNDWDGEDFPSGTYFFMLQPGTTNQTFKGSLFLSRE